MTFFRPFRPVLFGAPMDCGTGCRGTVLGPAALRRAGLAECLGAVRDLGDVAPLALVPPAAPEDPVHNLGEVAGWVGAIHTAAASIAGAGDLPVMLGGDHAASMGSVSAVARAARRYGRELFVLWIDAHADYNTPRTSPSGNLHGMVLSALCGEPDMVAMPGCTPAPLTPGHAAILGARSIDPGEQDLLDARGIEVTTMQQIARHGVAAPLGRLLARLAARDALLHVSFDVDVLDPVLAPGVGTPEPGGLGLDAAREIFALLRRSGRLAGLDIVETNPARDRGNATAALVCDLVAGLLEAPRLARAG